MTGNKKRGFGHLGPIFGSLVVISYTELEYSHSTVFLGGLCSCHTVYLLDCGNLLLSIIVI